jgi:50S ribosomal subunit-associated GTPase HflX
VKEYPADEIQQIDNEHLTTKEMHILENLAELPVIDRERLILE